MANKIRILIAKAGLDGHDRGAKIITRALRDAGFEVIYTGLHQTPEMIAEADLARKLETTGNEVLKAVHPHPTMSEAVMEAVADAYDEVIHI